MWRLKNKFIHIRQKIIKNKNLDISFPIWKSQSNNIMVIIVVFKLINFK